MERATHLLHILTRLDRIDDRRIRRRAPDSLLLQLAHQARFVETSRRTGELLLRIKPKGRHFLAFLHSWQLLIFTFAANAGDRVTIKGLHASIGLEDGASRLIAALQQHCRGVVLRVGHLARNKALPDQVVQAPLFLIDHAAQHLRRAPHIGWANRFVRLLRALVA